MHTGPGGGSDVLARAMVIMLEKELLPVRAQVANKPGGGGVVAAAYLAEKERRDAHHRHFHRGVAHQPAHQQ